MSFDCVFYGLLLTAMPTVCLYLFIVGFGLCLEVCVRSVDISWSDPDTTIWKAGCLY